MLYIGADHGGFGLKEKIKEFLTTAKIDFTDVGNYKLDMKDDYVDFVKKVAKGVKMDLKNNKGIVICRSGVGSAGTANKYDGIMAVNTNTATMAQKAREDNDANILALGGDYVDPSTAWNIVKRFLNTSFAKKPRYIRRIKKIGQIEKKN